MDTLPMVLLLTAFGCCVLAVVQPFLCNTAGGLKDDCHRLANVSVPLAILSGFAAMLFAYMTGTLGRR